MTVSLLLVYIKGSSGWLFSRQPVTGLRAVSRITVLYVSFLPLSHT
ncbi:hypothetical protein ENTCAN_08281 [Enterobacter cancerogenus ATCC 35316]|nr:hypothetical protein ENTCAN_08281 [Enterobacter cancerogenus ATCC 35316]